MSRIWAHDRRICFFWVACGDDTVDQAKAQSRWLSSRNTTKLLRSPVMHRWLNSGARTMDIRADGQPGRMSFRRHGWRIPRPMARSWGFSTMAGRVAGSSDSYPVRFLLCHGGRLKNARGERERDGEFQRRSNNVEQWRNVSQPGVARASKLRSVRFFVEIPQISFLSLRIFNRRNSWRLCAKNFSEISD